MNLEVVHNLEDRRLCQWNELLLDAQNPMPFQKYEWAVSWWQNFSTDKDKLLIILAYEDKELVGIAPLMYRVNMSYTAIKFIGSGYFDYFDFIVKKGKGPEVINGIAETLKINFPCFEWALSNIPEESDTFKILKQSSSFDVLSFFHDIVPCIDLPDTKEKFYYQVKGGLRWDISRRERRLRESGEVEFKACNNIAEARELLEDFFSLHIKKWESVNGYSAFKFENMRRFMRAILEKLFPDKTINLYYILHGRAKIIAICPAFELGGKFIFYTHAYDPDFARCSPGKVLISKLINYSIDKQYREFDFGIGKEAYKLEWPCKTKQLFDIYLFNNKDTLLNCYLKCRRRLAALYLLLILPMMRRFRPVVYTWRMIRRRRGQYARFQ